MSGLDYKDGAMGNASSYEIFDGFTAASLLSTINKWRSQTLHIKTLNVGGVARSIVDSHVPFSAMWSPSFVPKPPDWPEQCRVVGTFTSDKSAPLTVSDADFPEFMEWYNQMPDEKPIFIGFGSMVIKDTTKLSTIIMEAARQTQKRVVVQSSWSKIDTSAEPLCFDIGACPHDWLLPKCCAVIHHGGAGTTAAGLKFALPTLVCPFFADQYMWAHMVNRAKVGPEPCPVNGLTSDILATKFQELTSEEIKKNVVELSVKMNAENGVASGLQHFLDSLPRDNFCSDINLIMGEVRIARYRLKNQEVKVGTEVAAMIVPKPKRPSSICEFMRSVPKMPVRAIQRRRKVWLQRHAVMTHALGNPDGLRRGILAGMAGCLRYVTISPFMLFLKPDKYARSNGALGCLVGLVVAPFFMIATLFYGVVIVFLDRVLVGFNNGWRGKRYLYMLDRTIRYRPFAPLSIVEELQDKNRPVGIRKKHLKEALDIAIAACGVFESAGAYFLEHNWHWQVAPADKLKQKLPGMKILSRTELDSVSQLLDTEGQHPISFSRFCLFIGKATKARFHRRDSNMSLRPSFRDLYGPPKAQQW